MQTSTDAPRRPRRHTKITTALLRVRSVFVDVEDPEGNIFDIREEPARIIFADWLPDHSRGGAYRQSTFVKRGSQLPEYDVEWTYSEDATEITATVNQYLLAREEDEHELLDRLPRCIYETCLPSVARAPARSPGRIVKKLKYNSSDWNEALAAHGGVFTTIHCTRVVRKAPQHIFQDAR